MGRTILTPSIKPPPPPQPREKKKAVYQTDIDKIRLTVFVDCLVSGDYTTLVVSGDPEPAELIAVWNQIHSDYIERVGGMNLRAILSREKELRQIVSRYDRIAMLIFIARHLTYTDDIALALQHEGFKFDSDADEATRERQLRMIEARQKTELLRMSKLLEAKGSAEKSQHQYTWKEFNSLLSHMSHGEGFLLRAGDLTVGEFCAYLANHRDRMMEAAKPKFSK